MKTRYVAALALGLATACRGEGIRPKLESLFESMSSVPRDAAAAGASSIDAGKTFAAPSLSVVLDDPRLSRARELERTRDMSGAARAMDEAHAALAPHPLRVEEECAWQYVLGRLHLAANEAPEAARAFDRVAGVATQADGGAPASGCALAAYASLRASEAYSKLADYASAVERARVVPEEIALHDDAQLLYANALADGRHAEQAVPIWRALLATNPRLWIDLATRHATALLDGADGNPDSHAIEALDLATRVIVEAPKIADTSGATFARARALALLEAKAPKMSTELLPMERAKQARAWLDAGDAPKALSLTNVLLTEVSKGKNKSLACNVAMTRAQATARTKSSSAPDAWGDAIVECAHDEVLVTALYSGGKACISKRPDEALARFAKVEELFPKHRLADDARFQAALVVLGRGDEARFTAMLSSLPDDYPQGDMRGEALFRVALLRMTKGDWTAASGLLDRIITINPDDRHWATVGRAAYFGARALAAMGNVEEARQRYVRIIAEYPLAFYMTQAYARLAQTDSRLAKETLDAAMAREPDGSLLTAEHKELLAPAFQRATRLLEVGEIDAARREFLASGATADGADADVVWTVGLLYDRASAPELGHNFARGRLTDYLPHYPAGRWRAMWEIAYPRAFESLVLRESAAHGIPPSLTWAIMREESDFFAEAKSSANAYGLMQLIVPTARGVAAGTGLGWDESSLKKAEVNVALGTKLLAGLRASFSGNPPLAIAAYNGGGGAVNRWLAARGAEDFDLWVEEIPWDETRGYIKRVLASEATYALLYDRAALDDVLNISRRAAGAIVVDRVLDGGSE